jgi:hypothetical protein
MSDLEARLRRLEDIEAIRFLKASFCQLLCEKYTDDHQRRPQAEVDAVARRQAAYYAEDGVFDGGQQFGVYRGREQIYEYIRKGAWSFSMNYYLNPAIEVDGDKARARWMLWETATVAATGQAVFVSGMTDEEYVRTPEGWRISRVTYTHKFVTPFDRPWSVNRNGPLALKA